MNAPSVAIVIPVKMFNDNLRKCLEKCLELSYSNYEIIVFPDEPFSEFEGKIKVIPTGNIGPALKRDLVLKHSKADLFAFLDDDAYPEREWLNNAIKHFKDEEVAAVGGPSVTPPESTLIAAASGHALSSIIVSGSYTYRYIPGKEVMDVDDYPSCNFIVRREIFENLGGFDSRFYPGEDTKLCLEITKKLGRRIIYDPSVLVYHHRRGSIPGHMRQMANYATHRGYFAKRYPQTSRKLAYFIPSLFVVLLIIGAMSAWIFPALIMFYLIGIGIYVGIVVAVAVMKIFQEEKTGLGKRIILIVPVIIDIIGTHLSYGIFFIKGIISKNLIEEE